MASAEITRASEHQVLATVRQLLIDVIGPEYADGIEITMETSFNADLELESIEFVALSAKLREHYGNNVNFAAFLADKDVAEVVELTVGQVVQYIVESLAHNTVKVAASE